MTDLRQGVTEAEHAVFDLADHFSMAWHHNGADYYLHLAADCLYTAKVLESSVTSAGQQSRVRKTREAAALLLVALNLMAADQPEAAQ